MARARSAVKWRERLNLHGFHTIFIEYERVNVLRWSRQGAKRLSQTVFKKMQVIDNRCSIVCKQKTYFRILQKSGFQTFMRINLKENHTRFRHISVHAACYVISSTGKHTGHSTGYLIFEKNKDGLKKQTKGMFSLISNKVVPTASNELNVRFLSKKYDLDFDHFGVLNRYGLHAILGGRILGRNFFYLCYNLYPEKYSFNLRNLRLF